MFLMSIVRDSNFSKKDNDEIFSVHLGPDVKFCIKIVNISKRWTSDSFFWGEEGTTIVSESVAPCPPGKMANFFPAPPGKIIKFSLNF